MRKFTKFNTPFRKAAVAVADSMGLEFISTPRQVDNGTLMFRDPETNTRYSLHESGYVRRHLPNTRAYQLNRVQHSRWSSPHRLLAHGDEQLGIMVISVINYRKPLK